MKLYLYFFKNILTSNFVILFITTCLLFIIKSLYVLTLIISKGLSIPTLIKMTILILPPFIVEILPIATVLSIIYTWSHLQEVKEITIMKSFGISNFKLSIAGILLGIFNTLLALFITSYLAPISNTLFQKERLKLQNSYNLEIKEQGKFLEINNNITIFINNIGKNKKLEGIFIHNTENQKSPTTIIAKSGYILNKKNEITFYLNDVNFQEANSINKSISYLFFKKYIFTIDKKPATEYIKKSAKDLYLWELLTLDPIIFFKNIQNPNFQQYETAKLKKAYIKDFNRRLTNILIPLCLAIMCCYFLAKTNYSRFGNHLGTIKSICYGAIIKSSSLGLIFNNNIKNYFLFLYNFGIIIVIIIFLYLLIKPHKLKRKETLFF